MTAAKIEFTLASSKDFPINISDLGNGIVLGYGTWIDATATNTVEEVCDSDQLKALFESGAVSCKVNSAPATDFPLLLDFGINGGVTSVAGKVGVVTLASADITDAASAATPSVVVKRDGNGKIFVNGGVTSVLATQTDTKTVTQASLTSAVGTLTRSASLAANFWTVGKMARIRATGFMSSLASSTQRWEVKAGSTVLADSTAITITNALTNVWFELDCTVTCQAVGSGTAGKMVTQGAVRFSDAGIVTAISLKSLTPVDYDTTAAAQLLDVLLAYGATNAGNTTSVTNFSVEILN